MPQRADSDRNLLGRLLRVLRWMQEAPDGEFGVRELSQALELPPSTMHRLLASLQGEGLVQQDPSSGKYRLGLEWYRMAFRTRSEYILRNVALPFMRQLVARLNETAFLGVYESARREMVFIAAVDSAQPVRYVVPLYQWIAIHASASGFAIMAFLPAEERQRIYQHSRLVPLTDQSITDPVLLEEELARVRERGYAVSHGQRIPGAVGIAAPIWGPDGRVIGDLHISVPEQRFDAALEPAMAADVMHYARLITEGLGTRMPDQEPL